MYRGVEHGFFDWYSERILVIYRRDEVLDVDRVVGKTLPKLKKLA